MTAGRTPSAEVLQPGGPSPTLDLRLLPLALATWGAAAVGLGISPGRAVVTAVLLLVAGLVVRRVRPTARTAAAARVVAGAVTVGAGALVVSSLHGGAAHAGPVPELARERAEVRTELVLTSDPALHEGKFAPFVVTRATAREVTGRGSTARIRTPVLVIGDVSWSRLHLGDRVSTRGRLAVATGPDIAGVLSAHGQPELLAGAGWLFRGVGRMREALVDSVRPLRPAERALVPALVDGDDSAMPDHVVEDFQTTGLTHLLAVSGANLTLVLAFVVLVGRWCGVRARGLPVLGGVAVVGFVLLARPEPSVLRAAAMGVVALVGTTAGGRGRGVRALCLAVLVLVLVDPWLARSVGFLLSTLATAGILLLSPSWSHALSRWLPKLLADAVAVPLAAQIVCTPVIAAISGQVSLIAVAANVLVAPAVGPATVLGLIGGLISLMSVPVGQLIGRLAGLAAGWIVWVSGRGSDFSGASVGWPVGGLAIVFLTGLCVVAIVVTPSVLRRRSAVFAVSGAMVLLIAHPVPWLGWPPKDWVMVICDVGQGDGLVLNAGSGVAVVVDAGPDPQLMDRCLDRLHVRQVALVVLTHFHADHVDGLTGVLDGRQVAEIEVSPLPDPPDRAENVARAAAANDVPVTTATYGERRSVGDLSWTVLGPMQDAPRSAVARTGAEGSAPNNASVVMLVEVRGYRFLLSGDAEPEEESDLLRSGVDLKADVYKVAHHGSANQDPDFVFATRAALAVVSVGADNDYGHPSGQTLGLLRQLGAQVYRTDQDGDIVICVTTGGLTVSTPGSR